MKQRGVFTITTLILLTVEQRPMSKTRLMQELVLNYNRVNKYCSRLLSQGLIGYDQKTHEYSITPQGSRLLKINKELAGFLPPVDQMIKKYSTYIEPDNYKSGDLMFEFNSDLRVETTVF